MSLSTRTRQWIELAAAQTRADFVRRYPGYFLVCQAEVSPDREVRWIRRRTNAQDTSEPVSVGRSPKCDIPLIDPSISNRHAQLFVDVSGRPTGVTDLGSHNGTRINGRLIDAHARELLADGDLLQLGSVRASIVESERAYSLLAGMA